MRNEGERGVTGSALIYCAEDRGFGPECVKMKKNFIPSFSSSMELAGHQEYSMPRKKSFLGTCVELQVPHISVQSSSTHRYNLSI